MKKVFPLGLVVARGGCGTSMVPGKGEIEATVEGLGEDQVVYLPPWSEELSRRTGRPPRTKILFGANSVQTRAHAAAEWAGGGGGVGTPAVVAEEE